MLEASQVEYKPFGKPPLQREVVGSPQAPYSLALPRADFDFTNEVVALWCLQTQAPPQLLQWLRRLPCVQAVGRSAAVPAAAPQTRVLAVRRAGSGAHPSMRAHVCAAAVRAVAALTTVGAVRPGRRSQSRHRYRRRPCGTSS